jgi:hypothetical protein
MTHTQEISDEVQNFLRDVGVDLAIWTHVMHTPKEQL